MATPHDSGSLYIVKASQKSRGAHALFTKGNTNVPLASLSNPFVRESAPKLCKQNSKALPCFAPPHAERNQPNLADPAKVSHQPANRLFLQPSIIYDRFFDHIRIADGGP